MSCTIEIYTSKHCIYCEMAKALLDRKGLPYREIHVSSDGQERQEMLKRANGQRTVPQIFINNKHIGGYRELYQLEKAGELEHFV